MKETGQICYQQLLYGSGMFCLAFPLIESSLSSHSPRFLVDIVLHGVNLICTSSAWNVMCHDYVKSGPITLEQPLLSFLTFCFIYMDYTAVSIFRNKTKEIKMNLDTKKRRIVTKR